MSHDSDSLRRRLDQIRRTSIHLRAHARDLYDLAWEPPVTGGEKVAGGLPDRAPRAGDPRARRLYQELADEAARAESALLGLCRTMNALFYAGSVNPEPSRGSTVSRAEFDALLDRQRARPAPTRLVAQPQHPGKVTGSPPRV